MPGRPYWNKTRAEIIEDLCIEPGQKYRLMGNQHCMKQTKIHILAIIEGMIVYRWFGKHKQYWHYQIETPFMFHLWEDNKQLIKLRR